MMSLVFNFFHIFAYKIRLKFRLHKIGWDAACKFIHIIAKKPAHGWIYRGKTAFEILCIDKIRYRVKKFSKLLF